MSEKKVIGGRDCGGKSENNLRSSQVCHSFQGKLLAFAIFWEFSTSSWGEHQTDQWDRTILMHDAYAWYTRVFVAQTDLHSLDRFKIKIRLRYWQNLLENCSCRCPTTGTRKKAGHQPQVKMNCHFTKWSVSQPSDGYNSSSRPKVRFARRILKIQTNYGLLMALWAIYSCLRDRCKLLIPSEPPVVVIRVLTEWAWVR